MNRILRALGTGVLLLAAPAVPAAAQTVGFKLGTSMSRLSIADGDSDQERISGFAGGGFIRLGHGRLSLQPEVLSVGKGTRFMVEEADPVDLELRYLEVPLLLHFPLTWGASLAPYAFGGPTVSFELDCAARAGPETHDCEDVTGFSRRDIDWGATLGGGFAFMLGPGAVIAEARYTWGITDLARGDEMKVRNRAALFLAGYAIPFGRR